MAHEKRADVAEGRRPGFNPTQRTDDTLSR